MYAAELVKKVAFRHTRFGIPQYPFNIEPIQLASLIFEIDRLTDTPGAIVEIGVARGMTTRFMCEHLVRMGCPDQKLYAIDTFQSFLKSDVTYEVAEVTGGGRKRARELREMFAYNDFARWKRNFGNFPFVQAIQTDCGAFDYATIAPIKLAFLDVDLYLPTKRALPKIYEHICKGGVILVDDVHGGVGACKAYGEFCETAHINPTILGNRCGLIRK